MNLLLSDKDKEKYERVIRNSAISGCSVPEVDLFIAKRQRPISALLSSTLKFQSFHFRLHFFNEFKLISSIHCVFQFRDNSTSGSISETKIQPVLPRFF